MSPAEAIDKFAVLRKTALFSTLSDEPLRNIAELASIRELETDQILYSEQEEATVLYVVAAGELRSIRRSADGREQVLSTETAGAVLGVVPLVNGGKFYSTTIADVPSELLCIEQGLVSRLCREDPEFLWHVAKVLASQVRRFAEIIESLALRSVEQRLAHYLYTIAHESGAPLGNEGSAFQLTLTRAEIASRIGSVREVVSRAFARLQKAGLIDIKGRRHIAVPSVRALRDFAGIQPDAPAGFAPLVPESG